MIGGLLLLAGGGLLAALFKDESQHLRNSKEYGPTMWRNTAVDKLLPDALTPKRDSMSATTDRSRAQWHRLGISEQTGCDDALSGSAAEEAKELGCKGALRATYVDPTGNTVVTVALVALPKGTDPEAMHGFFSDHSDEHPLEDMVRAYPVPGSLAADWSDARRNGSAGDTADDTDLPYALIASAGAVDGRKAGHLPGKFGRTRSDARTDRRAWDGAAQSLLRPLSMHLSDLLLEETS
ncbi:hypothetical protein ACFU7T_13525 [Streptomyces sp. NPDC057555]|uniref:hypothetical protein n=1 Tax=Streptomyces sp. NPDC057555 TaxID=3346166 RepID=UPI00369E33B6